MKHVEFELLDWKIKIKKHAKIGHFNDEPFSRLSNEIERFLKLELRWTLKINFDKQYCWKNLSYLMNNFLQNNTKRKNDVCRMIRIYSDAKKRTKN